jgi:hypothetical protein
MLLPLSILLFAPESMNIVSLSQIVLTSDCHGDASRGNMGPAAAWDSCQEHPGGSDSCAPKLALPGESALMVAGRTKTATAGTAVAVMDGEVADVAEVAGLIQPRFESPQTTLFALFMKSLDCVCDLQLHENNYHLDQICRLYRACTPYTAMIMIYGAQ